LATRIRWGYRQTATPTTGNYVFAICDASGRPIVNTGSVAYAGIANSDNRRSETIAATTFEAGLYWVMFGHTLTAGASRDEPLRAVDQHGSRRRPEHVRVRDLGRRGTVPATLLGFTDAGVTPPAVQYGVPMIELSVG
jgi:hypothetical protein